MYLAYIVNLEMRCSKGQCQCFIGVLHLTIVYLVVIRTFIKVEAHTPPSPLPIPLAQCMHSEVSTYLMYLYILDKLIVV